MDSIKANSTEDQWYLHGRPANFLNMKSPDSYFAKE